MPSRTMEGHRLHIHIQIKRILVNRPRLDWMNFATARQRPSVSINDFLQRLENIVNTFNILQLEPPSKATQAMRFIQGLEKTIGSSAV